MISERYQIALRKLLEIQKSAEIPLSLLELCDEHQRQIALIHTGGALTFEALAHLFREWKREEALRERYVAIDQILKQAKKAKANE